MLEILVYFFIKFGEILGLFMEWCTIFVQDTVYLLGLAKSFLVHIPTFFSWLPSVALRFVIPLFLIVVIYKVLGREG